MEGKTGGGEIRRVHIIYYLSRRGRVEQPHLIRVHHLNKNGVRLRDVKRWLSDLRGKDMPDSFAWSYKRRYKKGYVWQDLLDDDLITPISDNEFVLKGSEIVPTDYCLYSEGNIIHPKKETQTTMEVSPAFGSARSSVTDDSTKYGEEKPLLGLSKQSDEKSDKPCSFSSPNDNNISVLATATCGERKSNTNTNTNTNGGGRGSLFRNLLSCGGAETNDSVLVTRRSCGEICRDEKLGGSARVSGTHGQQHQQNARRSYDGGVINNAKKHKETSGLNNNKPCKPFHAPTCSQCGKPFKPEKMHTHMKSCRGIKGNAASLAASTQTQLALPHFLTN